MSGLGYATPEDVGIHSESVIEFINDLKRLNVNMHGFILVRGGKIFAEGYYKPFSNQYIHRMYSVGKSLVSIAIGFLEQEGKINLNDKICKYFGEYINDDTHEYIRRMKIVDLLTMTTAHSSTTYKRYKGNWLESFFCLPPSHVPSTVFAYDTSATLVLSALIERITNMELADYLKNKLGEHIELSPEFKFLKDPEGISQGGSGLLCKLSDVAQIGYVMMSKGKELLPDYFEKATTKQVDTSLLPFQYEQQGYGYHIWILKENGYAFYGMGGQLCVCYPEKDLMLVTMADTMNDLAGIHNIYEVFYNRIFYSLGNSYPNNEKMHLKLMSCLDNLETAFVEGSMAMNTKDFFEGKKFSIEKNEIGIESIAIKCHGDNCSLEFSRDGEEITIPFGLGKLQYSEENKATCSGAWSTPNTFLLRYSDISEHMAQVKITFAFVDDYITVGMKVSGQNPKYERYNGFMTGKLRD